MFTSAIHISVSAAIRVLPAAWMRHYGYVTFYVVCSKSTSHQHIPSSNNIILYTQHKCQENKKIINKPGNTIIRTTVLNLATLSLGQQLS